MVESCNAWPRAAAARGWNQTLKGIDLRERRPTVIREAEGAHASVAGFKMAGLGAKVDAEDVGKFLRDIGDGIADVGRHLTASRR